jgi:dihydroxyacetone kinase-like predicted kinase
MTEIWNIINSPAFITVVAALLLYGLNRLYAKKPLWQQWEGTIITAVKLAEKAIPDDVENKAFKRLNEALQYVVRVYEEARGAPPTPEQIDELKEGIQIVHSQLERTEQL